MKDRLALLLLVVCALAVFAPIALFGDPFFGHDRAFHETNVRDFRAGLEDTAYPRWNHIANAGLGAPTFLFYPPLPYYLGSAGYALTGSEAWGLRLAAMVLAVVGAVGMFGLVRTDAPTAGALVAAAIYPWMPYLHLDLFERCAWGEFTALMIVPALFWSLRVFLDRRSAGAALGLIGSMAALALSHLVTCVPLVPVIAGYVAWTARKRRSWAPVRDLAITGTLAAVATAAFLLPVVLTRDTVHLDYITTSRHGIYPRNFLFSDETASGYFAAPFKRTVGRAATAQLALLALAAGALLWLRSLRGIAAFVTIVAAASAYFATELSAPVWKPLVVLQMIQFPWRLCGLLALTAAWLAGLAIGRAATSGRRLAVLPVAAGIVGLLWVTGLQIHAYHFSTLQPRVPIGANLQREYIPHDVQVGVGLRHLRYDPKTRFASADGVEQVDTVRWTPHRRILDVTVRPTGGRVTLPIFDYPGWTVTIDGKPHTERQRNALRLIEFSVPAGSHRLEIRHDPTRERSLGLWLSLVGIVAALGFAAWLRRRARPAASTAPQSLTDASAPRARWPLAAGAVLVLVALTLPLAFPSATFRPSVVLITSGVLRADHATFNGYVRKTTANLDDIALFDGVRCRFAYPPVTDRVQTAERIVLDGGLLETLRARGYRIGAFWGESLGDRLAGALPEAWCPDARTPSAKVVARAAQWTRTLADDAPIFLWVHLADTSPPYAPPAQPTFTSPPGPTLPLDVLSESVRITRGGRIVRDAAKYRDWYDESVLAFDRAARRLVNDLHRRDLYDRSAVFIAGLGGVDVGDGPAPFWSRPSLHEVATAVVLIAKFPGNHYAMEGGIERPISLAQIPPTVMALIGAPFDGVPIQQMAVDRDQRAPVIITTKDGTQSVEVFEDRKERWTTDRPDDRVRIERLKQPPWERPAGR